MLARLTMASDAGVISIQNPGFEDISGVPGSTHYDDDGRLRNGHLTWPEPDGGLPEGLYEVRTPVVPGWVPPFGYASTYNPDNVTAYPDGVPEGENIAIGSLNQTLTDVLAPGTYTLRVSIGYSNSGPLASAHLGFANASLSAGGSPLGNTPILSGGISGEFLEQEVVIVIPEDHFALGGSLGIHLQGGNQNAAFDNVRLDFAPVPEPGATAALAALGCLGWVVWQRQQRRRAHHR
jgi:hypothetical protein